MNPSLVMICLFFALGVMLMFGGTAVILGATGEPEPIGGTTLIAAGIAIIVIICMGVM